MPDIFAVEYAGNDNPARNAFQITPDDAAEFDQPPRAVYVGSAGNLAVEMLGGAQVVFSGIQAGSILPIRVRKVLASGTTAGAIVGIY